MSSISENPTQLSDVVDDRPAAEPEPDRRRGRVADWFATPTAAVRTIFIAAIAYHLLWLLVSVIPLNPGADSDRYLEKAFRPAAMFNDIAAPAGYSMFLRVVGALPERPLAILFAQHALQFAAAWLLWVLGRQIADRVGVSRWWAVPAAVFGVFNGDLTFYAHTAMTETLSFFLFIAFVLVAERMTVRGGDALASGRILKLAIAFGVLAAGAQCVRTSNGLTAAALLLVTLPFIGTWRARAIALVGAGVAGALVMGLYLFAAHNSYNKLTGLGGIQGWMLYGRTSSFADCKKAPAPKGLSYLCDKTPRKERYGPFYYAYPRAEFKPSQWSPAVRHFGGIPNGNAELERYSLNAILHQPMDYIAVVVHDMGHYLAPSSGSNPWYSTPGPEFEEITKLPETREGTHTMQYYGVSRYHAGPLGAWAEWWLEVSRFPPLLLLSFVLLPFYAIPKLRDRELSATVVPVWVVGMFAATLPIALVSYEYRYGLGTQMLFAVIGPIMVGALLAARRRRKEPQKLVA